MSVLGTVVSVVVVSVVSVLGTVVSVVSVLGTVVSVDGTVDSSTEEEVVSVSDAGGDSVVVVVVVDAPDSGVVVDPSDSPSVEAPKPSPSDTDVDCSPFVDSLSVDDPSLLSESVESLAEEVDSDCPSVSAVAKPV